MRKFIVSFVLMVSIVVATPASMAVIATAATSLISVVQKAFTHTPQVKDTPKETVLNPED